METHNYIQLSDEDTKKLAQEKNKQTVLIFGIDEKAGKIDMSVHSDKGSEYEKKILKYFQRHFILTSEYVKAEQAAKAKKKPSAMRMLILYVRTYWVLKRVERKMRKMMNTWNLKPMYK